MKKLYFLLPLLLAAAPLFSKTTVIYHTSDAHGFLYPEDGRGGYAALKAVLDKETHPYILLDSGDNADGSAEARLSHGKSSLTAMNAMGYAAAAIGNHEFDFGDDVFMKKILPLYEMPVLAANMYDGRSGAPVPGTEPFKVINADGVRIGVIGLALGGENTYIKFRSFISSVRAALKELLKENPDVVVLLTHTSIKGDREKTNNNARIVKNMGGKINIVLGGHAHYEAENIFIDGVLFAEPGENLKKVTRVEVVTDDKTGKFISASSNLIPLDIEKTGEDAEIKKLMLSLSAEKTAGEKLSYAPEFLSHRKTSSRCLDAPMDNAFTDILLSEMPQADVFMTTSGVFRGAGIDAGDITKRTLIELSPFDNYIWVYETDGKFLKSLIRKRIIKDRATISIAGVTVKSAWKNDRVKELAVFYKGKELRDTQKIKLAVTHFLAEKKDLGFRNIEENKIFASRETLRELLEKGVKKKEKILPVKDCRMERL